MKQFLLFLIQFYLKLMKLAEFSLFSLTSLSFKKSTSVKTHLNRKD